MSTNGERPTKSIPASTLTIGHLVMGFRSVPDREVMDVFTDHTGTAVTYFDGGRDSFPSTYRVCVIL